jgi:hypothetical protein
MRFNGEVAIVTGASKGIGVGIAKVLANDGAKVVVVARNEEGGQKTVNEIRQAGGDAFFVKADIADEEQVKAMVQAVLKHYGRIDILVNNAGLGVYKSISDATSEDWDRCMNVDMKGVFLCSKYCVPHMQARGKGAIVNISSVHAFRSTNGTAVYDAAKGGVSALTRSMAIDLGPTIRVNDISPGWIYTPLIQSIFDSYPDPAEQRRVIEQRQVMKRIGTPEDVGHAVSFLVSDEASFITGVQLFVDGGLTATLETW